MFKDAAKNSPASRPVTRGTTLFTAHAVERIAERFEVSIDIANQWLSEARPAHKSEIQVLESRQVGEPAQRNHRNDGLTWLINREHDAAFLIRDLSHSQRRVVVIVFWARLRESQCVIEATRCAKRRDHRNSTKRRQRITRQRESEAFEQLAFAG